MTNVENMIIGWLAFGAAAVFLMVCAWHNRRHGYQKLRPTESPVGEAILWLARINGSLSCSADTLPIASQRSTTSEQLVCLNSALQSYGQQASLREANEIEAPVGADPLSDHPRAQA